MKSFRQTKFWKNYLDYEKISVDSSMRGFADGLLFWKLLTQFDYHKKILEIGSYQGQTTGLFFDSIPDARVISVDIVDRMDLFRSNYKEYTNRHQLLVMPSQKAKFNESFDIVFIDGDHNHSPCQNDIMLALKHLNPNGLLILDDYNIPGVSAAIKDLYSMNCGWVPFMQGIQTQFWHHCSQNKNFFLDSLLVDPITNFLLIRNIQDHQNNSILQAECVRMLTDHYNIFDRALSMYNI